MTAWMVMALILAAAGSRGPAGGPIPPPPAPVGEDRRVAADDIDALLSARKIVLLDVREPKELEELGAREGYINIPLGDLEKRLGELPKDKAILTA